MRAFSSFFFLAAALGAGGCKANIGGNGNGGDDVEELPPLVPTPEGYVSRPEDEAVALPVGTTIDLEQLYSVGSDNPPPELLGGQETHITVTLRTDNPSAFPGDPEEEILGLHLYVNGCPLPLESASPPVGTTSWRWFVEDDDIPIQILRGHFMVWEIRAWKCPPVPPPPDAGPDAAADADSDTDADTDSDTDSSTDTAGGESCEAGPPQEIKVVFRAIDQLPPGDGKGAGLPNFLTPAEGEVLAAGDSLTVTWTPLGLTTFVGHAVDAQMQGWIQGGALDLRPDPATAISVDADRGTLTFNVGSFEDWDWINMNVVVPLENFPMRVVGAVGVN